MTTLDVRLRWSFTGGGHLREVSLIAIWLTEEPIGILVRWSLKRDGRSGSFHCRLIALFWMAPISPKFTWDKYIYFFRPVQVKFRCRLPHSVTFLVGFKFYQAETKLRVAEAPIKGCKEWAGTVWGTTGQQERREPNSRPANEQHQAKDSPTTAQ